MLYMILEKAFRVVGVTVPLLISVPILGASVLKIAALRAFGVKLEIVRSV